MRWNYFCTNSIFIKLVVVFIFTSRIAYIRYKLGLSNHQCLSSAHPWPVSMRVGFKFFVYLEFEKIHLVKNIIVVRYLLVSSSISELCGFILFFVMDAG